MAERYVCKLSSEALKKAVVELNEPEDNDARLAAIDKLKTRFQEEQNDLELIRSDDAFLLRFLRVKKFDQDRAYKTLVNYHRQRKDWKELFDYVDNPKKVKTLLSAGPIVPLKNFRAKDGSFFIVARLGRGIQEKEDILRLLALFFMTLEKLFEDEEFQIYGMSILEDMKEFGVGLSLQLAPYGSKMLYSLQEAMPVRVKTLNTVNEGLVYDALWALFSPFMKEKTKRRIRLHGTNFKTLHDVVDRAGLPKFLDGTGPELDEGWWAKEILNTEGIGEDTSL